MADSSWERDPIDKLADEFLERQRRGESPSIDDYAVKYPDLAEEIRDLFPALVMMEELKPGNEGTAATNGTAVETKRLERLGDYRILREVGRGGMGIVYEAEQESLGRRVALKLLPAQALLDSRQHKRFQREAKAAARLHHTNIVPVFGVGAHDGMNYYVMQFIHGLGLDQVLKELNRLRKAKALEQPIENRLPQPRSTATVSAGNVAQALLTGTFAAAVPPAAVGPEASIRSSLFPPTQSPVGSSDTQAPSGSSSSLILPGQSDRPALLAQCRPHRHSGGRRSGLRSQPGRAAPRYQAVQSSAR